MLFAFIARFSISVFVLQSISAADTLIINPLGQLFVSPQESIICCRDIGERILKTFKPDIETFKDWNSFTDHVLSDDYLAVSQVNRYCNDELRYPFSACWNYLCDRLYPEVRLAYFPRERLSEPERSYCDALHAAVTERSEEKVALFKKAVVEHNMWKSTVFQFCLNTKGMIETPDITFQYRLNVSPELELKKKLLLQNEKNDFSVKQIIDRFVIFDIMKLLYSRDIKNMFDTFLTEDCLSNMQRVCENTNSFCYKHYKEQLCRLIFFKDFLVNDFSEIAPNIIENVNDCLNDNAWFNKAFAFAVLNRVLDLYEDDTLLDKLTTLYQKNSISFRQDIVHKMWFRIPSLGELSWHVYNEIDGCFGDTKALKVKIETLATNNPVRLLWHIIFIMTDKQRWEFSCHSRKPIQVRIKRLEDMVFILFRLYPDIIKKTLLMRTLKFYEPSTSMPICRKNPNDSFARKLVVYIKEHSGEINGSVLIDMLESYCSAVVQ